MRIIAFVTGLLLLWNVAAVGSELKNIRVHRQKSFLRMVLDLSTSPEKWHINIEGPGRIGILLANTSAHPSGAYFLSHQLVRINLMSKGRDLNVKLQFDFPYFEKRVFALNQPPRIVVDLFPKDYPPPEMVDEIYAQARRLIKSQKFHEALQLLEGLGDFLKKYPKPYSDYLVLLIRLGKKEKAIELFEKLPPSFPMRPYLLKNMGRAYSDTGAYNKALALYEKLSSLSPKDMEAIEGGFLSLFKAGRYQSAFQFLKRIHSTPTLLSRLWQLKEDAISSLPPDKRQDILEGLLIPALKGRKWAQEDYFLCLVLFGHFKSAVQWAEEVGFHEMKISPYILNWLGWAYFKTGEISKAKKAYREALNSDPKFFKARIGLAYCAAASGDSKKALDALEKLLHEHPDDIEVRFARAYVFEKQGYFLEAVKEYDRILINYPENRTAQKLRLLALADLGAPSLALSIAIKVFPHDKSLHASLRQRIGAEHIRWKELELSKKILLPLVKAGHRQAMFDYIVALAEAKDMKTVLKFFEMIKKKGFQIPPYVYETVAGAYLYTEKPHRALEFYNRALSLNPNSLSARMGKFYTLQELRRWDEAWRIINKLDLEMPRFVGLKQLPQPNWRKVDIALAKGWLFAHEDRLAEANEYFFKLYEKAPAHTGIRDGLAHVYLWRGWPRRSLEQFKIIETLDKNYRHSNPGLVMALDQLAYKEEARGLASEMIELHPRDKFIRRTLRALEVEQMREFNTHVSVTREDDSSEKLSVTMEFSQPVSLYTRMYINGLWLYGSSKDTSENLTRSGLGVRHTFNSALEAYQQLSFYRNGGNHLASYTELKVTPSDHLELFVSFDSHTADIPIRAMAQGIRSHRANAKVRWRESELRSYYLSYGWCRFSDLNRRQEFGAGFDQLLYTKRDWAARLFIDLYGMENSKQNRLYYNPESAWGASATFMIQQTLKRLYDQSFVHRLFVTFGLYDEKSFSPGIPLTLRYEQDHEFSDTSSLFWALELSRNIYDGENVEGFTWEMGWRWRF